MQVYKLLTGIGAIILVMSVFMPARLGMAVGYVAYITAQPVNGLMLIAVAVMAILVIYSNRSNYMFVLAMTALVVVIGIYLRQNAGISITTPDLSRVTAQVSDIPFVRSASGVMNFVGGWWMMAAGAVLLVAASLIVPKRR